jgi:hypothetical protein
LINRLNQTGILPVISPKRRGAIETSESDEGELGYKKLFDFSNPPRLAQDSGSESDEGLPASFAFPVDNSEHPNDTDARSILFTNLDPHATVKNLMEMLKSYGEIHSVDLSSTSMPE